MTTNLESSIYNKTYLLFWVLKNIKEFIIYQKYNLYYFHNILFYNFLFET